MGGCVWISNNFSCIQSSVIFGHKYSCATSNLGWMISDGHCNAILYASTKESTAWNKSSTKMRHSNYVYTFYSFQINMGQHTLNWRYQSTSIRSLTNRNDQKFTAYNHTIAFNTLPFFRSFSHYHTFYAITYSYPKHSLSIITFLHICFYTRLHFFFTCVIGFTYSYPKHFFSTFHTKPYSSHS